MLVLLQVFTCRGDPAAYVLVLLQVLCHFPASNLYHCAVTLTDQAPDGTSIAVLKHEHSQHLKSSIVDFALFLFFVF